MSAPPAAAAPRELAETREAAYRFLLAALDKPAQERHAWLREPDFRRGLETLCDEFGAPLPPDELVPADFADYESDYIAAFEVGVPGPPVPLVASHYNRREPAPRIIHEHVLFYRRFGARPVCDNLEPADHLLNELAFLVHLDKFPVAVEAEAESVLRARHDFLTRQAAAWPARAAEAADAKGLPPPWPSLLALVAAAMAQDRELTGAAVARLIARDR
jgi:hypothetical protein